MHLDRRLRLRYYMLNLDHKSLHQSSGNYHPQSMASKQPNHRLHMARVRTGPQECNQWCQDQLEHHHTKIGSESCRERVCQYVEVSGVHGTLTNKTKV